MTKSAKRVKTSVGPGAVVAVAVLLAAGLAAAGLSASGAQAESLQDALASAYKFNPRLDAERARLRATDEEVPRAKSGYRPTVTGSADAGYQRVETKPQSSGDGETHPKGYGLNVTQPVFRGFRVLERRARGRGNGPRRPRDAAHGRAVGAAGGRDGLHGRGARPGNRAAAREQRHVLAREFKATQDRFSVGEVTRTDVAQAEARRAASVSALDLARANLKTSRATFERVVGHPPSTPAGAAAAREEAAEIAGRGAGYRRPRGAGRGRARSTASRPPATTSTRPGASCCPRCSSRPAIRIATTPRASPTSRR